MDSKIDFLFYSPEVATHLALNAEESFHAVKVLRKKVGDIIEVTDGQGGWFTCEITHANEKVCKLKINFAKYSFNKHKSEIIIGISPTKNSERIEYFVEKGTEIGLSEIQFVKTQNTYPKKVNMTRMYKIAVSAMKQSLRAYLPRITELESFKQVLQQNLSIEARYIAHLSDEAVDIMEVPLSDKICILIGPEGDFSNEELALAKENGFKCITLGRSRLRTETAGIYALTVLNARIQHEKN